MFALDLSRPKLASLVTRKKDSAARLFCEALEHNSDSRPISRAGVRIFVTALVSLLPG